MNKGQPRHLSHQERYPPMNRTSLLLCALYLTTSSGLAWTTVFEFRYGPVWAAFLFAAASLIPVIAIVREAVICEQHQALGELNGRAAGQGDRADAIVRAELDAACCERWWTSFGADHDTTCPRRIHRSSAA